jgi:hypothetical protein
MLIWPKDGLNSLAPHEPMVGWRLPVERCRAGVTIKDRQSAEQLRLADPDGTGSPTISAGAPAADLPEVGGRSGSSRTWRSLVLSGGAYLVLSVFIWSNVWTSHPSSVTTCGCGDSATFLWYIEWPAHALAHGLNLFFSTAMNHPTGINLLSNTGVLAITVAMAPVTWLFGPVAGLNVALTLAPVLSALAMFALLRRWVSWTPAAFVGGLLYGFSPFIIVELNDAHLMLGMAMVPPLMVICLDELVFRQRNRPIVTGVLLGLLVTLQFFISTEMLLITTIVAVLTLVLVLAYVAWRQSRALRRHARYAMVGLAAAAVTTVALLAYPAWYALAGPANLSGKIWPSVPFDSGSAVATLKRFVTPSWSQTALSVANHRVGGYQGPLLSWQYFGPGVLVVLIGGCIAWRRDRRLWMFGAAALISVVLSFGVSRSYLLPWQLLVRLPLMQNVITGRFVLITYLAVAVMVGLIVDHTYLAVNERRALAQDGSAGRLAQGLGPRLTGALAGVGVALIALLPPAVYLAQGAPLTTQPVVLPTWFRTVAPRLDGRQVLLIFPAPFSGFKAPLAWQAVNGMRYSIVGTGGPGSILNRAGKERDGQLVLDYVSDSAYFRTIGPGEIAAIRQALDGWGVTMVVIPDQPLLPPYERYTDVTRAAAVITAATGLRPVHHANAWVWTGVDHARQVAALPGGGLSACTEGLAARGVSAVDAATECVLK